MWKLRYNKFKIVSNLNTEHKMKTGKFTKITIVILAWFVASLLGILFKDWLATKGIFKFGGHNDFTSADLVFVVMACAAGFLAFFRIINIAEKD